MGSVKAILMLLVLTAGAAAQGKVRLAPLELVRAFDTDQEDCIVGDLRIAFRRQFRMVEKDLNDDGKPEYVVKTYGSCFCGAVGNCQIKFFRKRGKRYESLIVGKAAGKQFSLLRTKSHGYRDIRIWSHHSADESFVVTYKFDGNKYKASSCYAEDRYDVSTNRLLKYPLITKLQCPLD